MKRYRSEAVEAAPVFYEKEIKGIVERDDKQQQRSERDHKRTRWKMSGTDYQRHEGEQAAEYSSRAGERLYVFANPIPQ